MILLPAVVSIAVGAPNDRPFSIASRTARNTRGLACPAIIGLTTDIVNVLLTVSIEQIGTFGLTEDSVPPTARNAQLTIHLQLNGWLSKVVRLDMLIP